MAFYIIAAFAGLVIAPYFGFRAVRQDYLDAQAKRLPECHSITSKNRGW